jgi:adenosylhomocysteine nucleosidase
MPEIGIVAAFPHELKDARRWPADVFPHAGRTFQCFRDRKTVLVFGGMGREVARQAAKALVANFHPAILASVGFAGAIIPELRVGDLFIPDRVVDEAGHEIYSPKAERASGTLVTASRVAGPDAKRELHAHLGADAVDMEAIAVAQVAAAHGLGFFAVKSISDESGFAMPPFHRFARSDGSFDVVGFAVFAALRPRWWAPLAHLSRNASIASAALGRWLSQYNEGSPAPADTQKEMAHTR